MTRNFGLLIVRSSFSGSSVPEQWEPGHLGRGRTCRESWTRPPLWLLVHRGAPKRTAPSQVPNLLHDEPSFVQPSLPCPTNEVGVFPSLRGRTEGCESAGRGRAPSCGGSGIGQSRDMPSSTEVKTWPHAKQRMSFSQNVNRWRISYSPLGKPPTPGNGTPRANAKKAVVMPTSGGRLLPAVHTLGNKFPITGEVCA